MGSTVHWPSWPTSRLSASTCPQTEVKADPASFIDRDYRYKSVSTQSPQYVSLVPIRLSGNTIRDLCERGSDSAYFAFTRKLTLDYLFFINNFKYYTTHLSVIRYNKSILGLGSVTVSRLWLIFKKFEIQVQVSQESLSWNAMESYVYGSYYI